MKKKSIKKQSKVKKSKCEMKFNNMCNDSCKGGCFYFLGFIGAATYNISVAAGFWIGVWGVIKALVWPAFLVYGLMKSIGL